MDLDTLLTTVYVWVDDWYKIYGAAWRRGTGRPCRMSDSEVLTLGIVGQWRVGVPWQSERGLVRYMQRHGRGWFPQMLQVSAYNYRLRQLWSVFVRLQQVWGRQLDESTALYEVVDSVPLPAFSLTQGRKPRQRHWLTDAALGTSKQGWFWGHRWLVSLLPRGGLTGWTLAPANVQDRWLLQALLSARTHGFIHLLPPRPLGYVKPKRRLHPPVQRVRHPLTAGMATARPYLADQAFNGAAWLNHWQRRYGARVLAQPSPQLPPDPHWDAPNRRWLHHHRQVIETVFAVLTSVFDLKRLGAHSDWGQLTRLAAISAAFNVGIVCNRLLQRPDLALETLLC